MGEGGLVKGMVMRMEVDGEDDINKPCSLNNNTIIYIIRGGLFIYRMFL